MKLINKITCFINEFFSFTAHEDEDITMVNNSMAGGLSLFIFRKGKGNSHTHDVMWDRTVPEREGEFSHTRSHVGSNGVICDRTADH